MFWTNGKNIAGRKICDNFGFKKEGEEEKEKREVVSSKLLALPLKYPKTE